MSRQSLAKPKVFYCDKVFLGRDKVGQHGENLCRDRVFFIAIENLRTQGFHVTT